MLWVREPAHLIVLVIMAIIGLGMLAQKHIRAKMDNLIMNSRAVQILDKM